MLEDFFVHLPPSDHIQTAPSDLLQSLGQTQSLGGMADPVDFASLETMTAAMNFAPVALVILDRKRALQRANKMAEAVSCRGIRLTVRHK